MKRRSIILSVLVIAGLSTVLALQPGAGPQGTSSLSRGSSGLSAARRYLENRGVESVTLDRLSGEDLGEVDVVVIAGTPFAGFRASEEEALLAFVNAGGALILGFGPDRVSRGHSELLGVSFFPSTLRSRTLNPLVWKKQAQMMTRSPLEGSGPVIALPTPAFFPVQEKSDRVLARNSANEALILVRNVGQGKLIVAPIETFSNGLLREPGNAALLEGLRQELGEDSVWGFDEYHHGVVHKTSELGLKTRAALDLFLFQLVVTYLLFVAWLGRRFGPPWPEPPAISGATSSFLETVAATHDRMGHHKEAAESLRARAREVLGIELEGSGAAPARTPVEELLRTARDIHTKQREKRGA